ncbi:hypothetical protein VTK73DRAFT_6265 [Phialemonium thermophilum]|uniref:Uncharacterized protein n=1 Tax=Phialemonium thermophilum TaxID=223376 RepID=A0ABR3WKR2_9PEZI
MRVKKRLLEDEIDRCIETVLMPSLKQGADVLQSCSHIKAGQKWAISLSNTEEGKQTKAAKNCLRNFHSLFFGPRTLIPTSGGAKRQ